MRVLLLQFDFFSFKENNSLNSLAWLFHHKVLSLKLTQSCLALLFMSSLQLWRKQNFFLTLKQMQFWPVSIGYDRWHYFPETKLLVLSLAIESVLAAAAWHWPEHVPSWIWWNVVSFAIVTGVIICLFCFLCIPRVIFNCQYIMMTGEPCLKCVPNAITKNKNLPFNKNVSWAHLLLHLLLAGSCNWFCATSVGLGVCRCFPGKGEVWADSWASPSSSPLPPGHWEVWVPPCFLSSLWHCIVWINYHLIWPWFNIRYCSVFRKVSKNVGSSQFFQINLHWVT